MRGFFEAQWKIFNDAGKFYKVFPFMISEFSRFFNMSKVHAGSTRVVSASVKN